MVPCDALEDAAERLNDLGHICVGFHATLNAEWSRIRWGSVSPVSDVQSVLQPDGTFFLSVGELESNGATLEHGMKELQAQLDRGRELNFDFRYADQHMGFGRAIEGFEEAFDRWCDAEGMLNYRHYHRRLVWSREGVGDSVDRLIAGLKAADAGQWAIVGHPGYETEKMQQIGNEQTDGVAEATARDWQRRWFMDPRVTAYFDSHEIEAIRYDEAERMGS